MTFAPALCAQPQRGSIRVRVEARIEPLTNHDTHPTLHWVLLAPPTDADISMSDPGARALLLLAITDTVKNPGGCTRFSMEERGTCSFPALLKVKLRKIAFQQLSMKTPPGSAGAPPETELQFQYTIPPPPRPTVVRSLTVTVSTAYAAASKHGGRSAELTWEEAARRLKRQPPPPEGAAVRIRAQYTAADGRRSRGGSFSTQTMENALLAVGVAALESARAAHCLPGSPGPSDVTMSAVQNALTEQLTIPVSGWPRPVVSFRVDPATEEYQIQISGLRIVPGVRIEIVRGKIQGASGMVEFVGANPRLEREIQQLLATTAEAVSARTLSTLKLTQDPDGAERDTDPTGPANALTGHVPTASAVAARRNALDTDRMISGNVDVRRNSFSQLIFSGTRRWSVGKLNVSAELAGSFTPENFITGQASLDAANLSRNILQFGLGESYNLSVQGGSEVQNATLNLSLPRSRGSAWMVNYGVTHSLFFTRDAKQRFGNSNPGDLPLLNRQMGMTPQLFAEASHMPGSGLMVSTRAQASYDWRAVLIAPRTAGDALIDGQLSAPTAEVRHLIGYDFAKGFIGTVRLQLDGVARRGTRAFHGNFAFDQFTALARVEVFFAGARKSDVFLRYERGLGQSGAGTPLFALLRLGGPTNVRGIENGEFVGRNLAYDQSNVGVSVLAIAGMFHKGANGGSSPKLGGFDLANVYVVGLYDRGRVTNAGSLGDLLSVGPAAHSYGIAGELRKLPAAGKLANITVGWARSPQSRLHTHGVMTLGVSFDF